MSSSGQEQEFQESFPQGGAWRLILIPIYSLGRKKIELLFVHEYCKCIRFYSLIPKYNLTQI